MQDIVDDVAKMCNAHLIFGTETWLSDEINDGQLLLSRNYVIYRKDRTERRGGGVLLAVHKSIVSKLVSVPCDLEIIFVNLHLSTFTQVIVGVCYRPPNANSEFCVDLHCCLSRIRLLFPNVPLVLAGDFNMPGIDWSTSTVPHMCLNRSVCLKFLNLCTEFNLTQIITSPTRENALLDLFLITCPDRLLGVTYLEEISDHKAINVSLLFMIERKTVVDKYIFDYKNANVTALNACLRLYLDSFLSSWQSRSVDDNWLSFRDSLLNGAHEYIPRLKLRFNSNNPWYSSKLKRLANTKNRAYRQAKASTDVRKWVRYHAVAKEYKKEVAENKRRFYCRDLPRMLKTNPKKFWSVLKAQVGEGNSVHVKIDGTDLSDLRAAQALNHYFSSVFTSQSSPSPNPPLYPHLLPSTLPTITPYGVSRIIDNLSLTSSPGCDNITTKLLKITINVSAKILAIIFQQSLCSGEVPSDWKHAIITPIPKIQKPVDVHHYRPISLTSVSSKIMEHVLYAHIMEHLEEHDIIFKNQHGFRKNYSCESQLFELTTDLFESTNQGFQVDVIFVDFKNAFDRVSHSYLIVKLSSLNIHPSVINWISNFLLSRTQCVRCGNSKSETSSVLSGVPQGSVLGPLLFLIFINDLPQNFSCSVRLYADDLVLYHPVASYVDCVTLQYNLDVLEAWCNRWAMEVNIAKTKVMSVSRVKTRFIFDYAFQSICLERVQHYKYLGIFLSHDLSWKYHVEQLCSKASRSLGFLKRTLYLSPPYVKLLAYNSLVRSKLEYAAVVWSPYQQYLVNQLELLQNNAVRFIFNISDRMESMTLIKKSNGIPLLAARRKIMRLLLMFKLFHCGSSYVTSAHFFQVVLSTLSSCSHV